MNWTPELILAASTAIVAIIGAIAALIVALKQGQTIQKLDMKVRDLQQKP